MSTSTNSITFMEATEEYLLERDVSPLWEQQIRDRARKLTEYLGGDIPLKDLTCKAANEWLQMLQKKTDLKSSTLRGYRTAIHAVWKAAYMGGHDCEPPMRLRLIKKKANLVQAYTVDELRKLYKAAGKMTGSVYATMIPRKLWWPTYIQAAYSTGLRRGCLLAMDRRAIQPDGTIVVRAQKTNKVQSRRLCPEAVAGIKEIAKHASQTSLAFPFGRCRHDFFDNFIVLRMIAGIEHGSSKWIRRSAISYAEASSPGAGRLLGGHSTDEVTNKSYRDFKIAPEPVIEPPAINWND